MRLLNYEFTREIEMPDQGDYKEVEVEIDVDFSPGSRDYFCKSFGNWLPGDPISAEITEIRVDGRKLEGAEYDEYEKHYIDDVLEKACEEYGSRDRSDDY